MSKNGDVILNPAAHLTCYRTDDVSPAPPTPSIDVNTTDQFGDHALRARMRAAKQLCVPSLKVVLLP